jgi:hypothetical protein
MCDRWGKWWLSRRPSTVNRNSLPPAFDTFAADPSQQGICRLSLPLIPVIPMTRPVSTVQ